VQIYIYSNTNIFRFDVNRSNDRIYTSSERQGIRCYVLGHDGRRQHRILCNGSLSKRRHLALKQDFGFSVDFPQELRKLLKTS